MKRLTARQVHLDFHTSPYIENIGENFSKENFQKALKVGNVSSITLFAKCHHSLCYYPTEVGIRHPHLKFDLLTEMIEAAHEIGVKAPIYITAGWSAEDAEKHPEWWVRKKDGTMSSMNDVDLCAADDETRPEVSWINLCLNDGSYCNHIYELTQEIADNYKQVDGLFYDICSVGDQCYCAECVAGMEELGMDPHNEEHSKSYYIIKRQAFMDKCSKILLENHLDASLFFNGMADQNRPEFHNYQTHFEMEDLPTVWGGYDKMPPRAKFFAKRDKDFLGMTGKFHTAWGEFGGFKSKDALKYEVPAMLTYGSRCSIGDQLHPDGEFDMETYKNIGYAYDYVKKIEDYCYDGEITTKLGVYLTGNEKSDEGLVKILLETQNDFDVVSKDNFDSFEVVLFPDYAKLSEESLNKLIRYIKNGGKVLFTGESLISDNCFRIDVGAEFEGEYGFDKDFIVVGDKVSKNMVTSPILCYSNAKKINVKDSEVLATLTLPYFNRTYKKYCSHKNTPFNKADGGHPAMIKKGNVIYIAHKICEMYYEYGALQHKNYFINALNLLYSKKVLKINMMSAGRVTLIHQKNESRYCLNLLYASPIKHNEVEVIEDLPVIAHLKVEIIAAQNIKRVYLPIDNEDISFSQIGDEVFFTVPKLQCHELVVLEY